MSNDSKALPRSSGIFSGLFLLVVGVLWLLSNYTDLSFRSMVTHWWPLVLVAWGLIKLYERTVAQRQGRTRGWITAGEVFLVIGLLCVVGVFVIIEHVPDFVGDHVRMGDPFSFDFDAPVQPMSGKSRIAIRTTNGDITVTGSDAAELRVNGKKTVQTWNENSAQEMARNVNVEVVKTGDSYEIRPSGFDAGDSRYGMDLDVSLSKHAPVTIRNEKGDIQVTDMSSDVAITTQKSDIDVSDTTGNVSVETRNGDTQITDTRGDVKISGKGQEVEVINVSGQFTLEGEFYGPIRAEKITKGVRFVSQKTDLTLTQLTGRLEATSGDMQIVDAPGNITLNTNSRDVSIENPGGKVIVSNRDAAVEVRYSNAPKDDIQITNSSADITLSLPSSSNFDIVADCHSCDIENEFDSDTVKKNRTDSGDSHLEGKIGSGRGPKIILKTSYGTIHIRKTS